MGLQQAVQDHLARVALQETTISVHAFFEKKNWAAFRNGISWVNPNVWSASNQEKFGDALRVYVGDKTPKGQWDLLDEDGLPTSLSPAALENQTRAYSLGLKTLSSELIMTATKRKLMAVTMKYLICTNRRRPPLLSATSR